MANRRTQMNLPDGTKWRYGYDRLSQVVSGDRMDATTNAPVAGGSFRYAYDCIGNRTSSQDGSTADLRSYSANSLNQYVSIFTPGIIPIRGRADADAKVAVTTTVGGASTTYMPNRSGQDFSIDIPVDNSQGAVTAQVTVDALRHDGTLDIDLHRRLSGDYTVPAATPETPAYDADGNLLTCDGWTCAWNAQDRLVSATKGTTRLEFNYDYLGRRFEKKVYENNVLTKHSLFIYDGFKQIAEYDALDSNALANTYLWQPVGLDVPILRNGQEFYVSDANKNIVALIDTTGQVTDTYLYDPFGNCAHTGSSTNHFQFSSEYFDEETNLVYYNYRYYTPRLGRWIKRDPIDQGGGINLYSYCLNAPALCFDIGGLWSSLPFPPFNQHEQLTTKAFKQKEQDYFLHFYDNQELDNILKILVKGNNKTDGKEYFNNLRYHFNRLPGQDVQSAQAEYLITWYVEAAFLKIALAFVGDHDPCCNRPRTLRKCKGALLRIGRLAHMLQDFFAHAIVNEKTNKFWHPEGSLPPDASPFNPFSVIPSSYDINEKWYKPFGDNYYWGNGEHGGLLNREPGNRAIDHETRWAKSILWTERLLQSTMPSWNQRCSRCAKKLIPPPRHKPGKS